MANYFSKRSEEHLSTCHLLLQGIFRDVLRTVDCAIIEGHRKREIHESYLENGLSQVSYEVSKHSKTPSMAVHAMPIPIDWKDREKITYFAGFVMGLADIKLEGTLYALRWGGDWDRDFNLKNNNFDDLAHYELIEVVP